MSRLSQVFQSGKKILNIYCTAGYPKLDSTLTVMKALQDSGADIIELGMPYSDPLADGETIQKSSAIALDNGMTMQVLFEQLAGMRQQINIPVVLMGYMNPVLQYGFEQFCADAAKAGVDGLILPDLPQHEFEKTYKAIMEKYNLNFIFLVTPETSEERIKKLDQLSSGFLYAVSSSSTTGGEKDFNEVELYLKRLQGYGLKNPILVGFGIRDKKTFYGACKYAQGAIIGSAYIKIIQHAQSPEAITRSFVQSILN
ncbi:tryptophan synthase subunit alpha [Niabella yanshanensis]|uniref:Tryptophan synthase alpha chain n=1 Tax=Niabella yanshanensis TaxID=577386 RepID=A0ABZ0W6B2_9BACT|nr:tryptophan synthase subunit alpha [Niabella yanshanensis]WQD37616.1 tryptophan synthase subunit alpha [Niabella yanshanensis]